MAALLLIGAGERALPADDVDDTLPRAGVADVESAARGVRAGIERYAFPRSSVADIHSQVLLLSQQRAALAAPAATALVTEWRYVTGLLHDLDRNQRYLQVRNQKLRAQARKRRPLTIAQAEQKQRLLDLSSKKISIQTRQRERLAALTQRIGAGLRRMTSPGACAVFADLLPKERDVAVARVLIDLLGQGKHRAAVPTLIRRLSDRALKTHARTALTSIANVDLGKTPGAWRRWWKEAKAK